MKHCEIEKKRKVQIDELKLTDNITNYIGIHIACGI